MDSSYRPMPGITNFYDYKINHTTARNELVSHPEQAWMSAATNMKGSGTEEAKFLLAAVVVGVVFYLSYTTKAPPPSF